MLTNCTENNTSDLYNVLIQQPLFDLETEPCDTCDLHEECHQDATTITIPDLLPNVSLLEDVTGRQLVTITQ